MLRRWCDSRSANQATSVRGDDNEQAETDPGADQRRQRPRRRRDACRQRSGQRIDDAAEQHRLDELRAGERDIGQRQRQRQSRDRAQQAENAEIDADEGHDDSENRRAMPRG